MALRASLDPVEDVLDRGCRCDHGELRREELLERLACVFRSANQSLVDIVRHITHLGQASKDWWVA